MKWLPVDLVLVSIFAAIGRFSHDESLTLAGWAHTAWPFLAGALIGWGIVGVRHLPGGSVAAGVAVWPVTVAGGMVLRALTDQGVAVSFIIVASVVLGLFLVGSRLVVRLATRRAS
ncbi:MAG: DUF3054 domain-containing protein [Nocardioidaceae bacterium]